MPRRRSRFATTREALESDEDIGVLRLNVSSPKDLEAAIKLRKRGQPFVALAVPVFLQLTAKWTLQHLRDSAIAEVPAILQHYQGHGFVFCSSPTGEGCGHKKEVLSLIHI